MPCYDSTSSDNARENQIKLNKITAKLCALVNEEITINDDWLVKWKNLHNQIDNKRRLKTDLRNKEPKYNHHDYKKVVSEVQKLESEMHLFLMGGIV
jgi:hypothetical protein